MNNQEKTLDPAEELIAQAVIGITRNCRMICPACGPERKKHNEPTLSVTVENDGVLFQCWHCSAKGKAWYKQQAKPSLRQPIRPRPKVEEIKLPPARMNQQRIRAFLEPRGLKFTPEQIDALPLAFDRHWFAQDEQHHDALGFVYGERQAPKAIKWRAVDLKIHTQDNGAREFYNLAAARKALAEGRLKALLITEGEFDTLAGIYLGLEAEGIIPVSVPNGAPKKVSDRRVSPEEDQKFAFIWDARDVIEGAERIILATDDDAPGEALREELARRIGRARCWETRYPQGCKDLNDVVRDQGPEPARAVVQDAKPMPLQGVYSASDYRQKVEDIFNNGVGAGVSTGYSNVDQLFTVAEGQLSVVTGLPGSGKSEFIDQLMVNLAQQQHWKFAVCSFENQPPQHHIRKLAEKIIGKSFESRYGPDMRMSGDELEYAIDFINDHFVFLESRDGEPCTLDSIIERTKQAVMRMGVRGLVIDPYNYIEGRHAESETDSISVMLTKVISFAKAYGLHIWFVAHPAKMLPGYKGQLPVPTGMNISGSMHWWNKADIGITVHRGEHATEIHCWKVRFKWIGRTGVASLDYDIPSGRYRPNLVDSYGFVPESQAGAFPAHYLDELDSKDFNF